MDGYPNLGKTMEKLVAKWNMAIEFVDLPMNSLEMLGKMVMFQFVFSMFTRWQYKEKGLWYSR